MLVVCWVFLMLHADKIKHIKLRPMQSSPAEAKLAQCRRLLKLFEELSCSAWETQRSLKAMRYFSSLSALSNEER